MIHVPFCPHLPFDVQDDVLQHPARELFILGGAGGGKTEVLMMAMLLGVENPDYRGLLVKSSYSDLVIPGNVLPRYLEWFSKYPDIKWDGASLTFIFPSGATIKLCYMKRVPPRRYKLGREYDMIAIDHLNNFQDDDYDFITRRAKKSGKIRCTAYPEKGWIKDLVLNSHTASYIQVTMAVAPIVWT